MTTSTSAPKTSQPSWITVAQREILVRVTDRNFILGFVMTLLLMGGAIAVSAVMGNRPTTATVVTSDAESAAMVGALAKAPQLGTGVGANRLELTAKTAPDAAAARAMVERKEAEGYLHRDGSTWVYTTRGGTDVTMTPILEQAIRTSTIQANAAKAGTSFEALTAGAQLRSDALQEADSGRAAMAWVLGIATATLLYMMTLLFGYGIASSVVEEKQSRIIEIIAAAVPLRSVLTGKVVGNTLLAFGQMAILAGLAVFGVSQTPMSGLIEPVAKSMGWFLAFFLLTFALLATLYAALGALASRVEDLQSTTMPLTMVLAICFIVSMQVRDAAVQQILSFIPLMSTFVMPGRVLAGEAAWWEPLLSLGLTLVATVALLSVAERLYRRSIMQTGGRLTLKEALKLQD